MDIVTAIRQADAGRDAERLALRYAAMRDNAFSFFRGCCFRFNDALAAAGGPPAAPRGWLCGDLHAENFGSYKGDNRLIYFDINDFDEAALGPVSWDATRLLAGLQVAAHAQGAPAAQGRALGQQVIDGYATALQAGSARWVERDTAQGLIGELLDRLRNRKRVDFLDKRTLLKGKRRRLRIDGRHALAADAAQRAHAQALVSGFSAGRPDAGFFEVLDVARRIAGTGSLGLERYVVLVEGKGSPDQNHLLDLKLAAPSSLVRHLPQAQPAWASQAQRITTLQGRLQAVPIAFLHPVADGARSYVLRGLQPSEDRITLDADPAHLPPVAQALQTLGRLLAWAQLRSAGRQGADNADVLVDFGAARSRWQAPLIDCAAQMAQQALADWRAFAQAVDDGALRG